MGFPGVISSLSLLITGFRSHLISYPDSLCMLQFWLKFMVQCREIFHTWNPNDPCFDWKRPCFEGFNHQNRGFKQVPGTWSIWATFFGSPDNRPPKIPPSFAPVRLSQEALNTEPVALVDAKVLRGIFWAPLDGCEIPGFRKVPFLKKPRIPDRSMGLVIFYIYLRGLT